MAGKVAEAQLDPSSDRSNTVEFGSAGTSRLGARMVYLSSDQLLPKGPVVGL